MNTKYCAHRGFNTVAPENSLAAFELAILYGADEIEMDLWPSRDGKIVVNHDPTVDRTTNGNGKIIEMSSEDIKKLDSGIKFSEHFAGTRLCFFDEVLKRYGNSIVMNLHIKTINDEEEYDEKIFKIILDLIKKYNCESSVYFTGYKDVLKTALRLAPQIERCSLEGRQTFTMVEEALKYKCKMIQFNNKYIDKNSIDKAHKNNIICNLFWSDDYEEAQEFINMGIDVILTNDFLLTARPEL